MRQPVDNPVSFYEAFTKRFGKKDVLNSGC
jgi:hypothetical protein